MATTGLDFEESQKGTTFIGKRVFTNVKITEALKMFENVTTAVTTSSSTLVLPNTNSTSIAVQR